MSRGQRTIHLESSWSVMIGSLTFKMEHYTGCYWNIDKAHGAVV